MSAPAHEPQVCPVCSARLEGDGVCLVCLLNEGFESEAPTEVRHARSLSLPCDFAGYRLVREIASGGMGIVYEAEDVKLKRVVALKVIRNAVFATREEAARFKAETQAVAQLDHPGIVPIYESGEEDGVPFYTMRLAEGGSLADRLKKRGVLSDGEAAQMMSRIARAVQHAHDHGVLHRDLKPANILLDVSGRPMLSDFGLAKLLDAEFQLTRTQAHVGTPHYMSPEQAAGNSRQITTASDVWALGVMLYQMLADRLPFQGGSAVEVMRRIIKEEPEISSTGRLVSRSRESATPSRPAETAPPETARIQPDLATLILRCLEKQPARRLPGAGFLADELDRFLEGKPIQSRAVGPAERLWKLALRNKAAALALLGTSLSLIAGTVVSVWQAVKATEARKVAVQQKEEAETVTNIILSAVNELDDLSTGRRVNVAEIRGQLLKRIHGFRGDPLRKAALINGIHLISTDPISLGSLEKSLAQVEQAAGPDDETLWCMRFNLAAKLALIPARRAEAIALLRRVLAWEREHFPPEESYRLVATYLTLGEALSLRDVEGAREAVDLLAEACRLAEGETRLIKSYVVRCRFSHAGALYRAGRQEEALAMGRENCHKAVALLGKAHLRTALTFEKHARNCRASGLVEEALASGRTALECYWTSVGPDDEYAKTGLRFQLESLQAREDRESRLALLRDAARVSDQQLGPVHPTTLDLVETRVMLLIAWGRHQDSAVVAHEWLERARLPGGALPPVAEGLLRQHSRALRFSNKHPRAEAALRELVAMQDQQNADTLQRQADLSDLAETLLELHRPAEALPLLKEAVRAFEERGGEAKPKFTQYELSRARQRLEAAQRALGPVKTAAR